MPTRLLNRSAKVARDIPASRARSKERELHCLRESTAALQSIGITGDVIVASACASWSFPISVGRFSRAFSLTTLGEMRTLERFRRSHEAFRRQMAIAMESPFLFPSDRIASGDQATFKTVWTKTLRRAKTHTSAYTTPTQAKANE
jgi:hypothetical protein